MNISETYSKIEKDFKSKKELVSVKYSFSSDNMFDIIKQTQDFYESVKTPRLESRKRIEVHYHNALMHQLFSHLQEIKYYSDVNIFDTRRLVSVSSDCISSIQILVRKSIHINTYFRSSDFDGALPVDLILITSLPKKLFDHLNLMNHLPEYKEISPKALESLKQKKIKINLFFGSLHRTNDISS